MKEVTVIIPVKDEEDGLLFLVDDFRSSELYNDPSIQLSFVIDGRTSDNSRAVARNVNPPPQAVGTIRGLFLQRPGHPREPVLELRTLC